MPQSLITDQLLKAKQSKDMSFAELGAAIGRSEVWTASLVFGQATASSEEATQLLEALGLGQQAEMIESLTTYPVKGSLDSTVPVDPLLYRFHEILQIYGMPIKAVIQEKFGDGIMSAIDFTMAIDKQEDPKGDRVVITLNGKFLAYKKW